MLISASSISFFFTCFTSLFREIATISYRSGPEWEQRFGRKRNEGARHSFMPEYLIETYLDHQGTTACLRYDPNSLIYISKVWLLERLRFDATAGLTLRLASLHVPLSSFISHVSLLSFFLHSIFFYFLLCLLFDKAMDMFDLTCAFKTPEEAMAQIKCPMLVIGVQSDLLFPVTQQRAVVAQLRAAGNERVTYFELDALYGHDTFLIDVNTVGAAVKGHLEHANSMSNEEPYVE